MAVTENMNDHKAPAQNYKYRLLKLNEIISGLIIINL